MTCFAIVVALLLVLLRSLLVVSPVGVVGIVEVVSLGRRVVSMGGSVAERFCG